MLSEKAPKTIDTLVEVVQEHVHLHDGPSIGRLFLFSYSLSSPPHHLVSCAPYRIVGDKHLDKGQRHRPP